MKKRTILSFLALLCLVGSGIAIYGQRGNHFDPDLFGPGALDVQFTEANSAQVVIQGVVRDRNHPEVLYLTLWKDMIDPENPNLPSENFEDSLKFGTTLQGVWVGFDKLFKFELPPITKPAYITISDSNKNYLEHYLVEPGDSVRVQFDNMQHGVSFAGPAAIKFKCQKELNNAYNNLALEKPSRPIMLNEKSLTDEVKAAVEEQNRSFGKKVIPTTDLYQALNSLDIEEVEGLGVEIERIINHHKGQISTNFLNLLKQDHTSKANYYKVFHFSRYFLPRAIKSENPELIKYYSDFFYSHISPLEKRLWESSGKSFYTTKTIDLITRAEAFIKGYEIHKVWEALPEGKSRDNIITSYLMDKQVMEENGPKVLNEAIELINSRTTSDLLSNFYIKFGKGLPIYESTFFNDRGEVIPTSSFLGKVTLLDFWYTGCKACIRLNENVLTPLSEEFSGNEDFQMISISADKSPEKWRETLKSGRYSPPGAAHLFTGQEGGNHPFLKHYDIRYFPFLIILDREGRVSTLGFQTHDYEKIKESIDDLIKRPSTSNKF